MANIPLNHEPSLCFSIQVCWLNPKEKVGTQVVCRVQQHSTELILKTLVCGEHLDHVYWFHLRCCAVLANDTFRGLERFRDFAGVTVELAHLEQVVWLNTNCLKLNSEELLRVLFVNLCQGNYRVFFPFRRDS